MKVGVMKLPELSEKVLEDAKKLYTKNFLLDIDCQLYTER